MWSGQFYWSLVRNSLGQTCWLGRRGFHEWQIDFAVRTWLSVFCHRPVVSSVNGWWWWYQTKCRCRPAECTAARMRRGGATWRTHWLLPLRPWWASMEMRTVQQLWGCCMTTTRCGRVNITDNCHITCYGLLWILFLVFASTLSGSQREETCLQQC